MRRISIAIALSTLLFIGFSLAQQTATITVPNLIRYSGALKDSQGLDSVPATTVGVTFAIYKQQDSGAPLWQETQNVMPDANAQYSVLLGSTTAAGLPNDLFSQQEERWLGIQVQGHPEESRVLLVSVPYAFKAHEAETLGGIPASAYALAFKNLTSNATTNGSSATTNGSSSAVLSRGTAGYIPLWLNPVTLGNSTLFQDVHNNIGIGTTKPGAKLEVNGNVIVDGDVAGTFGVTGYSLVGTGTGVQGYSLSGTGNSNGVAGSTNSPSGNGVYGSSTATTGSSNGVEGQTASSGGAGGLFQNLSGATGAEILVAEDSSGTQRFTVDTQGNVKVIMGNAQQPAPLVPVNHARMTVSIQSQQQYTYDLIWAFPFADTNYTVTCSPQVVDPQDGVSFFILAVSPQSVTVGVFTDGSPKTVTLGCISVHD